MPAKRPKRTLAYVRWLDASYQRGEVADGELVDRVELESAGLLVRETKEAVSIALDRYEHDGVWRYVQHIPRVNVLEIRHVKV